MRIAARTHEAHRNAIAGKEKGVYIVQHLAPTRVVDAAVGKGWGGGAPGTGVQERQSKGESVCACMGGRRQRGGRKKNYAHCGRHNGWCWGSARAGRGLGGGTGGLALSNRIALKSDVVTGQQTCPDGRRRDRADRCDRAGAAAGRESQNIGAGIA